MDFKTYLTQFDNVLELMLETTKNKNKDYAKDYDAFANFRRCEELGICSTEAGILTRMTDKLSRIGNLLHNTNHVKDESLLDSTLDMAVYSVILYTYLSNKWAKESSVQNVINESQSISSTDLNEQMIDYNDIAENATMNIEDEELTDEEKDYMIEQILNKLNR